MNQWQLDRHLRATHAKSHETIQYHLVKVWALEIWKKRGKQKENKKSTSIKETLKSTTCDNESNEDIFNNSDVKSMERSIVGESSNDEWNQ